MKSYAFDYTHHVEQLLPLFRALEQEAALTATTIEKLRKKHPNKEKALFSKHQLILSYRALAGSRGLKPVQPQVIQSLMMKPTRTISGVTPVTVLTKPFPCPGKCIFCPNDIRMPKSYLADEPGAQRAERNNFDPYLQTYNRLAAFHNIGHQTSKVEIIVLGGTWSYYPEPYQIWFIKECFRALNDFSDGKDDRLIVEAEYEKMRQQLKLNKQQLSDNAIHGQYINKSYNHTISELYVAPELKSGFAEYQKADWNLLIVEQQKNETARCRNVGLVIETRPDNISVAEVKRIRRLGCTKTQIGFQSLNDHVLVVNKRGHDVAATRRAVNLLRQAGFKIHAHWMPNLYGSSVIDDQKDYDTLFHDPDFKPDELKIYPCSLIESAELMQYYQRGDWKPYTEPELLEVLTYCLIHTPEYCRLTRVVRDIPSTDIVVGNKKTNFREIAERKLLEAGQKSGDIRSREIRNKKVLRTELHLEDVAYETSVSTEHFLQFVTDDKKIAGFLRLSLPVASATHSSPIEELQDAAIIREVHVYGQTLALGEKSANEAQHLGLGTELLEEAKRRAAAAGFKKVAVISAVGTREYYRKRGFVDGELYQFAQLRYDE